MSKDIELSVRAKISQARKEIDSLVNEIKGLVSVQDDLGKSGSKTNGLLGNLGTQFSKLAKEARGLDALGKIATELSRAGAAVSGLEGDVKKSAVEFARLARETEDAAKSAARLRGELEAEQKVLRANTEEQRAASKELTATNKLVAAAERNQDRYNKTLANVPQTKTTSGARSAGTFIAEDVTASRAKQAALTADIANYKKAIDDSKAAIVALEPQVAAAATQQRKLSAETEKTSTALQRAKGDLTGARTELTSISTAAESASFALTGTALDADKVAASSARMSAELARTKARIDGLNEASKAQPKTTATADVSGIEDQRRKLLELRKEWVNSQAEVKRLADAMRATVAPTAEMGEALGRAQAAARAGKDAYAAQQTAIRGLAGAATSSFGAFEQGAARLTTAQERLIASLHTTVAAAGGVTSALPPIVAAVRGSGEALDGAAQGGKSFRESLGLVNEGSRQSLSLFGQLKSQVLSLAAGFVGLYAAADQIGKILTSFQSLEGAQARLSVVSKGDTSKVADDLAFLERQAQRLGVSFGVLSDQYSKFAVAADAANFASEATRKIFLSVAEAGRVNRLSADELNGVFLALTQMISKGKVSAEELRGQLGERLTGAFNIFADAIGVSTQQLDQMMQKGEVLATQSTLLKFADQLDKRFGPQLAESLRGTTAELGRFSDNIFQSQIRIAEGGFIDGFTEGLKNLNDYFQSRAGRDFFLSLGSALGTFAKALASIPPYFTEIGYLIKALIGYKLGSYFTGIVQGIQASYGSLNGFVKSFYSLGTAVQNTSDQVVGFTNAGRVLGNTAAVMRTNFLAAGASLALLGVNATVVEGALVGLRGVMTVITGTARLMWAAIGGIPGIIFTGITLALGSWLTSVKDTTAAADEHKRVVQEIVSAYENAKDKTADWAKEIRGASSIQIKLQIAGAESGLNDLKKQLSVAQGAVESFSSSLSADTKAGMLQAIGAFRLGAQGADAFKERINALAEADPNISKTLVKGLLETADEAISSEDAIAKLRATLALVEGTATDADKALLGLGTSTDGAAKSTEDATSKTKLFDDALGDITKSVKDVSGELDRLSKIDALDKQYAQAARLAQSMGQILQLNKDYDTSLQSIISGSVGASGGVVDKIIGVESSGDSSAKNPDSTATGLGQFIESTWLTMFKKYFPQVTSDIGAQMAAKFGPDTKAAQAAADAAILEFRKNAKISRDLVEAYATENAGILKKAGLAVNDASVYLAHFLGPGGAVKLLSAPKGTPTSQILGSDQIEKNKSVLEGKTAEEVYNWAVKKVGVSQAELGVQKEINTTEEKRVAKAAEYKTELENRLSLQAQENENNGKLTKDAFVQKALAEEQNRARAAGVTLSDAEVAKIKDLAAGEYDIANAKKEGKTAQQDANTASQAAIALAAQRTELQKQLNIALKSGDTTTAASLTEQIAGVNGSLGEAIDKAKAMWEAIGGDAADVAITKLDTLKLKADASANSISLLGLSTQQIGQLAGSFADGLVGVFDSFAQAIANGENAVKSLGQAFLQFAANFLREMVQMILKQEIMNAVRGISRALGFTIPGLGAATAHTGGVVGSVGAGLGNSKRSTSPAIFAGAMRYHTGGIAGLRPNEVPIIAKKNEEILTESDPRHRNNGGMTPQGGSGGNLSLKSILVLDDESALKHLQSSAGERVTITHIKNNAATIKRMLGG